MQDDVLHGHQHFANVGRMAWLRRRVDGIDGAVEQARGLEHGRVRKDAVVRVPGFARFNLGATKVREALGAEDPAVDVTRLGSGHVVLGKGLAHER